MKKILMILFMASSMLLVHAQDNTKNENTNDINLLDLVQDQPAQPTPVGRKKSAMFWDGRHHTLELTISDPIVQMMLYHLDNENHGDLSTLSPEDYIAHKNYKPDSDLWLPTFNLQYHYAFNHWLELGVIVGTSAHGRYYTYLPDNSRTLYGTYQVYVMPSMRFTYLRRNLINLYAGLAVGVEMDINGLRSPYQSSQIKTWGIGFMPAGQFTGFGMQVGRRVYWNLEIGFGTKSIFNTGLGVKL